MPSFIEKDGVLIHHATGPAVDIDVASFINRARQNRSGSDNIGR